MPLASASYRGDWRAILTQIPAPALVFQCAFICRINRLMLRYSASYRGDWRAILTQIPAPALVFQCSQHLNQLGAHHLDATGGETKLINSERNALCGARRKSRRRLSKRNALAKPPGGDVKELHSLITILVNHLKLLDKRQPLHPAVLPLPHLQFHSNLVPLL